MERGLNLLRVEVDAGEPLPDWRSAVVGGDDPVDDLGDVRSDDVGLGSQRADHHPGPGHERGAGPRGERAGTSQACAATSRTSANGTSHSRATSSYAAWAGFSACTVSAENAPSNRSRIPAFAS